MWEVECEALPGLGDMAGEEMLELRIAHVVGGHRSLLVLLRRRPGAGGSHSPLSAVPTDIGTGRMGPWKPSAWRKG
jgi:hypothetical protein